MCVEVATPNLYAVSQRNCRQAPDTRMTDMGRRSGCSSSNDDVESPALKGVKSWVLRGALLARHAPHEPNPFPQVNTHDNTAAAAHRGVRRDSGLSPLSWDTPSLACHSLLGLLCEVVWVSDLECHRRMGTELWHGDASGPGLWPRYPLCIDPTDGFPVCGLWHVG